MENNLPPGRPSRVVRSGMSSAAQRRAGARPDDFFEQVFRRSNDAIILLELDSLEVIEVNAKAEMLYGYTRDEMIGMSIIDFIPGYLHHDVYRNIEAMGNGLQTLRFSDRPRLLKDGTEIRVHVSAAAMEYEGRLILQDVTRDGTGARLMSGSNASGAEPFATNRTSAWRSSMSIISNVSMTPAGTS